MIPTDDVEQPLGRCRAEFRQPVVERAEAGVAELAVLDGVHDQAEAGVDQLGLDAFAVELPDPFVGVPGCLGHLLPLARPAEIIDFGIGIFALGRDQPDPGRLPAQQPLADEAVAGLRPAADEARRPIEKAPVDVLGPQVRRLDDMRIGRDQLER